MDLDIIWASHIVENPPRITSKKPGVALAGCPSFFAANSDECGNTIVTWRCDLKKWRCEGVSMEGERITARLARDLRKLGLKARSMWDQNPCWLVYKGATVHYLVYCLLMTHVREPRSTVQYKRLTQGFESLLMRILLAKHGEINHQIWWWILQLW